MGQYHRYAGAAGTASGSAGGWRELTGVFDYSTVRVTA